MISRENTYKKQYKSITNIWEYAKPINKMKMNDISETGKS